jgi:serine/threonine protein kinase
LNDTKGVKVTDYFLGNRFLKEFRNTSAVSSPNASIYKKSMSVSSDNLKDNKDETSQTQQQEDQFVTTHGRCPYWVAPEILQFHPYDEKADVYSFGFLLYELLTKQMPWPDLKSVQELIDVVCVKKLRPGIPESVPKIVGQLIEECWDQDPQKRDTFTHLVPRIDDLIVDHIVADETGRKLWKQWFRGMVRLAYVISTDSIRTL